MISLGPADEVSVVQKNTSFHFNLLIWFKLTHSTEIWPQWKHYIGWWKIFSISRKSSNSATTAGWRQYWQVSMCRYYLVCPPPRPGDSSQQRGCLARTSIAALEDQKPGHQRICFLPFIRQFYYGKKEFSCYILGTIHHQATKCWQIYFGEYIHYLESDSTAVSTVSRKDYKD